jgi:uncharacterized membrane protein YfhO
MLKTTFEPRWHAMVDGVEVRPQMIAPDFVSVPVPAGIHDVAFTYQPYPYYPELLALGLITLLGLQVGRGIRLNWTRRSPPRWRKRA